MDCIPFNDHRVVAAQAGVLNIDREGDSCICNAVSELRQSPTLGVLAIARPGTSCAVPCMDPDTTRKCPWGHTPQLLVNSSTHGTPYGRRNSAERDGHEFAYMEFCLNQNGQLPLRPIPLRQLPWPSCSGTMHRKSRITACLQVSRCDVYAHGITYLPAFIKAATKSDLTRESDCTSTGHAVRTSINAGKRWPVACLLLGLLLPPTGPCICNPQKRQCTQNLPQCCNPPLQHHNSHTAYILSNIP